MKNAAQVLLDENKIADAKNKMKEIKEMKDAIASDTTGEGFIYDMFRAELSDHEYTYTYDVSDAIAACGVTVEEINADQRLAHGLWKATQDLKRWAEEHDW